jgi:oligosaccharyltransferase complex subunit beta
VFKEKGVLRLSNVTHHKSGQSHTPGSYIVTEDVVYNVVIEELQSGTWNGYSAKDIQLDFVRIDPFVRINLKSVGGGGKYEARFKIPDVYGVYQFKIDYQRKGYTFLSSATQVN